MRQITSKHRLLSTFLFNCTITAIILITFLVILGCAPFGDKTLAHGDGEIVYIPLFKYMQDVLLGKNSFSYSFTHQLGGTGIGLFSTLLSSPFNIFLVFFNYEDFHTFFNLQEVAKLSLASGSFAVLLTWRFKVQRFSNPITLVLSNTYVLSQACLYRIENIMWVDGIYLLPLMLLATSFLVRRDNGWFLSIIVALSMLFNWYTGFINAFFTFPWFIYERWSCAKPPRHALNCFIIYAFAIISGIISSAILLLPTVVQLTETVAAESLAEDLFRPPIIRPLYWLRIILQSFEFGGLDSETISSLELWIGPLAMIGVLGSLFAQKGQRAPNAFLVSFALAPLIVRPLDKVLGFLKPVLSSWPRYSYAVALILLLASAPWLYQWYATIRNPHDFSDMPYHTSLRSVKITFFSSLTLGALFLVAWKMSHQFSLWNCIVTVILLVSCSALVLLISLTSTYPKKTIHLIAAILVFVISGGSLLANAWIVLESPGGSVTILDGKFTLHNYILETSSQVENDLGACRVSIPTPDMPNLGFSVNAPFAVGLPSIETYSSNCSAAQIRLLQSLGYSFLSDNLTLVKTSLIPTDSLLGVRYIWTDESIPGLLPLASKIPGTSVGFFENPYYLPLGLSYSPSTKSSFDEANPFDYQQSLYSELLGRSCSFYRRADCSVKEISETTREFTVDIPQTGEWGLYGRFDWGGQQKVYLYREGAKELRLKGGLAVNVFSIPFDKSASSVSFTVTAEDWSKCKGWDIRFLDLDAFDEVVNTLREHAANTTVFENGHVIFKIEGEHGSTLFTSIPSDVGWTVTDNGDVVETGVFADCLLTIPLRSGMNTIEMRYEIPGFTLGAILSACGTICIIGWFALDRRKKQRKLVR